MKYCLLIDSKVSLAWQTCSISSKTFTLGLLFAGRCGEGVPAAPEASGEEGGVGGSGAGTALRRPGGAPEEALPPGGTGARGSSM